MQYFRSTDHREILKSLIAARKGGDRPVHFSALAERIGTQKTYVSKVMAGDGCWNADQAFLITEAFELSPDEEEYFCLLVELERSGSARRREKIKEQLKELRRRNLRTKAAIKAENLEPVQSPETAYFVDPYHSLAHVYLTLPKYQKGVANLAGMLGIAEEQARGILRRLDRLGMIEFDEKAERVSMKQGSIHSPSGHPLVQAHQALFRALAHDRMHRCPETRKNSFNVVFAGDRELQETIWAEFLEFLKRVEGIAKSSKSEEVFYLQFDLFPWSEASWAKKPTADKKS